jgi:predicted nucleic acid-binding protein
MARQFLDTSAVVKLYRRESNSPVIRAIVAASDQILISQLTLLEFRSAFWALVRQGLMPHTDAEARIRLFDSDQHSCRVLSLTAPVFQRATDLIDTYTVPEGLRPPDALQVACALEEYYREPLDAFVTTDRVQAKVALASGLVVAP